MKLLINLNDFNKIKRFAQKVMTFIDNIYISKDDDILYNAKSIISVMVLLDLTNDINVEIITQDKNEIERFIEEMEEFKIG